MVPFACIVKLTVGFTVFEMYFGRLLRFMINVALSVNFMLVDTGLFGCCEYRP